MIDASGPELLVGGHAIGDIVERFGEPLYVYDAETIRTRCAAVRAALPAFHILYSMKANPLPAIVGLCVSLLDGVDVSSNGEMQTALAAGCPPGRLFFVGPSKSDDELREAIERGIGALVVESREELQVIDELAAGLGRQPPVALRVNPAFEVQGAKLRMGGVPRQFGIDEEQIDEAVQAAMRMRHVRLRGLHVYVGTRILDWTIAARMVGEVLSMAAAIAERNRLTLEILDIGGGLGVPYFTGETTFDLDRFAAAVSDLAAFRARCPTTTLVMELGRYIVAESGVYVARIRYVKRSRGRLFALASGGMNHCQAASGAGGVLRHTFPARLLNRLRDPAGEMVTVCGPLCTPMDVIAREVPLPEPRRGDLVGILNVGAYGLTASPTAFISHGPPAEAVVDGVPMPAARDVAAATIATGRST